VAGAPFIKQVHSAYFVTSKSAIPKILMRTSGPESGGRGSQYRAQSLTCLLSRYVTQHQFVLRSRRLRVPAEEKPPGSRACVATLGKNPHWLEASGFHCHTQELPSQRPLLVPIAQPSSVSVLYHRLDKGQVTAWSHAYPQLRTQGGRRQAS
jgi:hypothetical protein